MLHMECGQAKLVTSHGISRLKQSSDIEGWDVYVEQCFECAGLCSTWSMGQARLVTSDGNSSTWSDNLALSSTAACLC